jgi:hypothetical protein
MDTIIIKALKNHHVSHCAFQRYYLENVNCLKIHIVIEYQYENISKPLLHLYIFPTKILGIWNTVMIKNYRTV